MRYFFVGCYCLTLAYSTVSAQSFARAAVGNPGTTQQQAISCAQQATKNTHKFVRCMRGQVVLTPKQDKLVSCAQQSKGKAAFATCAGQSLLNDKLNRSQQIMVGCALESGASTSNFLKCETRHSLNANLTADQKAAISCAEDSRGDEQKFARCAATKIFGSKFNNEQRAAVECAAASKGDASQFGICAGTKFLNAKLNPEQQIGLNCVVQSGGQPYVAGGCIATRLTARELEKCVTKGFGGDGCFGNNNELVGKNGWVGRTLSGNVQAAKREPNIVAGAVRAGTGISARDIGKYGLGGGHNSEVNKAGRWMGKTFGW